MVEINSGGESAAEAERLLMEAISSREWNAFVVASVMLETSGPMTVQQETAPVPGRADRFFIALAKIPMASLWYKPYSR